MTFDDVRTYGRPASLHFIAVACPPRPPRCSPRAQLSALGPGSGTPCRSSFAAMFHSRLDASIRLLLQSLPPRHTQPNLRPAFTAMRKKLDATNYSLPMTPPRSGRVCGSPSRPKATRSRRSDERGRGAGRRRRASRLRAPARIAMPGMNGLDVAPGRRARPRREGCHAERARGPGRALQRHPLCRRARLRRRGRRARATVRRHRPRLSGRHVLSTGVAENLGEVIRRSGYAPAHTSNAAWRSPPGSSRSCASWPPPSRRRRWRPELFLCRKTVQNQISAIYPSWREEPLGGHRARHGAAPHRVQGERGQTILDASSPVPPGMAPRETIGWPLRRSLFRRGGWPRPGSQRRPPMAAPPCHLAEEAELLRPDGVWRDRRSAHQPPPPHSGRWGAAHERLPSRASTSCFFTSSRAA